MSRYNNAKYITTPEFLKFKVWALEGDRMFHEIVHKNFHDTPEKVWKQFNPKASNAVQVFTSNNFMTNFGMPLKPKFLKCDRISDSGKIGDMVEAYVYHLYVAHGWDYVEGWIVRKINKIIESKLNLKSC